jgi:hypothetical protein
MKTSVTPAKARRFRWRQRPLRSHLLAQGGTRNSLPRKSLIQIAPQGSDIQQQNNIYFGEIQQLTTLKSQFRLRYNTQSAAGKRIARRFQQQPL